jgi:proteasome lid subunit RPN8/RPN11
VISVELTSAVIGEMIAHAREDAPNECCGLLLGVGGRIDECVRTRNVLASPTRYRINPAEHFEALRRVRGTGRAVVAAYHSHVATGAEPSPRDIAEAHDPDLLYVIVSLRDAARPVVRGYRIRDGVVEGVALVTSA